MAYENATFQGFKNIMPTDSFGINIIGYTSGNLGVGHTIRQFTQALIDKGIPVALFDLNDERGRGKFDSSFRDLEVASIDQLPFSVNMFVHGAHSIPAFAVYPAKGLQLEGRLNIAFVWWELTTFPPAFIEALKVFDVLIAGSSFIRAALESHVDGVRIIETKHPLYFPTDITPDRSRFFLPEDAFLVFCGFDPLSDPARKNPFAALRAFRRAFPESENARLVIKINNPKVEGREKSMMDQLMREIGNDLRVHLINETLSYKDLLTLYASCDTFISLHRSEGLGLIPMEAMLLGKPVVATGWSGNMSYMNHTNACLVGYDFTSTDCSSGGYHSRELGIHAFWAEPRIEDAAAWLRKLNNDETFRITLGERARADLLCYQEEAKRVSFVYELHSIWATREIMYSEPLKIRRARALKSFIEYILRQQPLQHRTVARAMHWLERHVLWRFR